MTATETQPQLVTTTASPRGISPLQKTANAQNLIIVLSTYIIPLCDREECLFVHINPAKYFNWISEQLFALDRDEESFEGVGKETGNLHGDRLL